MEDTEVSRENHWTKDSIDYTSHNINVLRTYQLIQFEDKNVTKTNNVRKFKSLESWYL